MMPQFFLTDADPWNDNVDMADAPAFSVTNVSKTTVRINVDYLMDGNWINALTNGGPFTLRPAQSRTVAKQNLAAEIVRVMVTGNNFRVGVEY
jgi:hypothetical protein